MNPLQKSAIGAALLVASIAAAGCGGSSSANGAATTKINLVAYSTPEGYEELIRTSPRRAGSGVEFSNSFGASGDQRARSRPAAGRPRPLLARARHDAARRRRPRGRGLGAGRLQGHRHRVSSSSSRCARETRRASRPGTTWSRRASRSSPRTRLPRAARAGTSWPPTARRSSRARHPTRRRSYLQVLFEQRPVQDKAARRADHLHRRQGRCADLVRERGDQRAAGRRGRRLRHPGRDDPDREPGRGDRGRANPEAAQAFIDYLCTPEAQQVFADEGLPSGRPEASRRRTTSSRTPEGAVHDRRVRRLGSRSRRVLRPGQRVVAEIE